MLKLSNHLQARVGDLGAVELEYPQLLEAGQFLQPFVRHFGEAKVQIDDRLALQFRVAPDLRLRAREFLKGLEGNSLRIVGPAAWGGRKRGGSFDDRIQLLVILFTLLVGVGRVSFKMMVQD